MKKFKSQFWCGGNLLRPDHITITDSEVIYKKRDGNLISINETVILIKNIVEITVEGGLFGDGLLFKTTGGRIKINGFNKNDIKTIVRLVHLCNK